MAEARALVVEDDRVWQQILGEILADAGLVVDVADHLEAAIPTMRAAPHRLAVVDLALSEGDHHNQDGLRVLDAVRLYDPGCATILLTGYATVEIAVSVLTEHGALTCLRKETFNRGQFRDLVQRALAAPSPAEKPAAADAPPKETVPALIVEDDANWSSIVSELVSDAGYPARVCATFGEALGYLRREKYSVAVVDLALASPRDQDSAAQNMDGYRLLASTRAGGIPTIVVSGVGTPDDIERAYAEQGIFAYFQKQTFDRRAFLQSLREARTAARPSRELDVLTEREREVLELLAKGMTNKEIAEQLVITPNTVKRHLKAIFEKLEIHTRSAAAAKAISAGVSGERR
ncbi:MAG: response regulator [Chloroflexi bacterium]|nr:response regulator [Chloroflexota bacterium]